MLFSSVWEDRNQSLLLLEQICYSEEKSSVELDEQLLLNVLKAVLIATSDKVY